MNQELNTGIDNPGQNKEYTIIVNAKPKNWIGKEISFEQVVVLAFGIFEGNPNIAYTMTYKRGHGNKPEGSLVKGETILVKNEMIFNVTRTDKS